MKKLQTLELADVGGVNDEAVAALVQHCQHVVNLNLSLCAAVTDKAVTSIARHLPHIQHLYLVSCKITDTGKWDWQTWNRTRIYWATRLGNRRPEGTEKMGTIMTNTRLSLSYQMGKTMMK